ncbi:MAG: thermonuclease family protein [Methylobacterium mesophilicum]|nr:thermonuclease family protein [Methylobacterium mesophilicum]
MRPAAINGIAALGLVVLSTAMVMLAPKPNDDAAINAQSPATQLSAEDAADMDALTAEPLSDDTAAEATPEDAPDPSGQTAAAKPEIDPQTGLERLPARPPLSKPEKPEAPKPTLLYRPVATAAGRLEAGGHVVEVQGVKVTEADQVCDAPDGKSWACGIVARTAFRNWLRNRAVLCTVPDKPSSAVVKSACTVGNEDAATWLVANGFAETDDGGPYAKAQAEAKQVGRGIWGAAPTSGG